MSQQIGGYPPSTATGSPAGQPTTQVARDEAAEVGRTAADAGRQVAGTAAEQAANVAQEVKAQARDLVGEARGQVQDQARTGQQKAAEGIRALSQELREMADGAQQPGTVSEVARQAADRADRLAELAGPARARRPPRRGAVLRPPPPRGVPAGRRACGRRRRAPHAGCRGRGAGRLRSGSAGRLRVAVHRTGEYPGYTTPGYTTPGYTAHTTPGYAAPGYTEPGYTEPAVPYGTPPRTVGHADPTAGLPGADPVPGRVAAAAGARRARR